jgi:AraC-like DNA-binding protein
MLTITDIHIDRGTSWFEEKSSASELTFIVTTYGKCVYWIGDDKVILERGDFFLIPDQTSFYGKSIPTVFHEKIVIHFTVPERERSSLPMLLSNRWTKSKTGIYELCLDRLRTMHKDWNERLAYADVRASAVVIETLALWSRELDRGKVTLETFNNVERMKTYIQSHYREKVTKDELGAWIGKSPNYAATLFRKVTGQPISAYVHTIRIRNAMYLLTESLLTVGEIADFLGYNDVSYFQRTFKRATGNSPSHYIKEGRRLHD